MSSSELAFISTVASLAAGQAPGLIKGIGDDCAVLEKNGDQVLLVTTDTLVSGVHFNLQWHPPHLLGRKAAAVNLSDIAAMGGVPRYALLSAALSSELSEQGLQEFMNGFVEILREHDVVLVGGDTVAAPCPTFSITLLGDMAKAQVCYRAAAREGDEVWVSGMLGEAAAGLSLCEQMDKVPEQYASLIQAHLNPHPRVALGRFLAASGDVHAMMDLSDGLATDLAHICTASGLAALVDGQRLPLSATLMQAGELLGYEARQWALCGGEDYELLYTVAPGEGQDLARRVMEELGIEVSCIGRMTPGEGVFLEEDGLKRQISYQGYEHHL
ncbi:MAG: thiamine-phosphate kinase [Proteobacteria bacterium]|nr:thiamine-phosphate kinase [Pseudomonadota bacterium]MBU1639341.1 thiamine-phosphate kinase [Pseudomonadota bacterium]